MHIRRFATPEPDRRSGRVKKNENVNEIAQFGTRLFTARNRRIYDAIASFVTRAPMRSMETIIFVNENCLGRGAFKFDEL